MDWTLYRDESGFDALKDEWNELLKSSRFDTIFLTWEWQTTWWQHLGRTRGPLFILAGRDAGRLAAVIPLYLAGTPAAPCRSWAVSRCPTTWT